MNTIQVQPVTFLFLFFTLYALIAFLFYLHIKQGRKKRIKPGKPARLVPFHSITSNITDPDELEERLSKLTDDQFQQWKDYEKKRRLAALPKPVLFHDIKYRLELRHGLLVLYANDFAILSVNSDQEVIRSMEVPAHLGFKITQKENKVKIT